MVLKITHTEKSISEYCYMKQNLCCNYIFPIDLAPNGNMFISISENIAIHIWFNLKTFRNDVSVHNKRFTTEDVFMRSFCMFSTHNELFVNLKIK